MHAINTGPNYLTEKKRERREQYLVLPCSCSLYKQPLLAGDNISIDQATTTAASERADRSIDLPQREGSMKASSVALLAAVMAVAAVASTAVAKDYTVGGSNGWDTYVDYDKWAAGKTFIVGDTISN